MSATTSQQIQKYFDLYSRNEVTFTREVIKATLLYPKQVFLKCLGYQWPCILYSSSMIGAKVIVNVQASFKQIVSRANNIISLRYSFIQKDKADPISFFINAHVTDYTPYSSDNPDLNFVNISFTNHPPTDLIEKLGQLIEAQANSQNRKEDRILLTNESLKELGLNARSVGVTIDNIPRKCIIRDLAFSGIKLIIMGVPKFMVGKPSIVTLKFENPDDTIKLIGKVVRFEPIEGRQDIGAFAIQFLEEKIPMEYKLRLSSYLKHSKPHTIIKEESKE